MSKSFGLLMALLLSIVLIVTLISSSAFAQHGHEPPPASVGNRNLTVSLNIEPLTADAKEYLGQLKLVDVDSNKTIPHVTYFITFSKEETVLLKEWFHDHEGDLPLKIRPKDASKITVFGEKEPTLGGWMKSGANPVIIDGPLLMTSGVYNFTIEIFSIDNDKTILDKPLKYEVNVAIGEQSEMDMEHGMQLHGTRTVADMHVELQTNGMLEQNVPVQFWLEITDATTGDPLEKVPHEFVIMRNDDELLREFKESASYQHEYTFTDDQTGPITVKLENLNNSGENIEFGLTVVPEFPLTTVFVMASMLAAMLAI